MTTQGIAHFTFDQPRKHLRPRELEVLRLLAEGLTRKEIAAEMGISRNTVDTYVKIVFRTLRASNAVGAVRIAQEMALV